MDLIEYYVDRNNWYIGSPTSNALFQLHFPFNILILLIICHNELNWEYCHNSPIPICYYVTIFCSTRIQGWNFLFNLYFAPNYTFFNIFWKPCMEKICLLLWPTTMLNVDGKCFSDLLRNLSAVFNEAFCLINNYFNYFSPDIVGLLLLYQISS